MSREKDTGAGLNEDRARAILAEVARIETEAGAAKALDALVALGHANFEIMTELELHAQTNMNGAKHLVSIYKDELMAACDDMTGVLEQECARLSEGMAAPADFDPGSVRV